MKTTTSLVFLALLLARGAAADELSELRERLEVHAKLLGQQAADIELLQKAVTKLQADYLTERKRAALAEADTLQLYKLLNARVGHADKPAVENPLRRHWVFQDHSELDATYVDFAGGETVLVDDAGEEYRLKSSELSAADRRWVQEQVKARTENEKQLAQKAVIRCPNRNCTRGLIYGPVSGGIGIENGGRSAVQGVSGRAPIGTCPTCSGRGVVPNPNFRR